MTLAAKIAELKERRSRVESAITTTMVMRERDDAAQTHIHLRGDFLRPGALVQGNTPAVLPPLGGRRRAPDRLDLARWLVDAGNPLTPRVTVNRVWQQYFGAAWSRPRTTSARRATPPTHPELLDWLASEFIGSGWSMKAMHRLIVTSATYRQSSRARPDLAAVDPHNKLLARQTRLRLEAEVDPRRGPGGQRAADAEDRRAERLPAAAGRRLPLHAARRRLAPTARAPTATAAGCTRTSGGRAPHPVLIDVRRPRRATSPAPAAIRSNTPLQALTLANDQAFFEMRPGPGRARAAREPRPTTPSALRYAFRLCLAASRRAERSAAAADVLDAQRTALRGRARRARRRLRREQLPTAPTPPKRPPGRRWPGCC